MNLKNRTYILVGEKQNWKVALEKKIWGFQKKSKGLWNTTKENDLIAFYVTKPLKKIIGFGIVKNKFVDQKLVWNDEKFLNRAIWIYKVSFDIFYVCDKWKNGIFLPKKMFLQTSRRVIDKNFFIELVKLADSKWEMNIYKKIFEKL